jgi:hypothetical protein
VRLTLPRRPRSLDPLASSFSVSITDSYFTPNTSQSIHILTQNILEQERERERERDLSRDGVESQEDEGVEEDEKEEERGGGGSRV